MTIGTLRFALIWRASLEAIAVAEAKIESDEFDGLGLEAAEETPCPPLPPR